MLIRLTDDEFMDIQRSAEQAGLAVGAWMGEAAARSVGRGEWELAMSRREVVQQLVRVRVDVASARRAVVELGWGLGESVLLGSLDAVLVRLDELIDAAVDGREL
ncbi:hypothetical protein [Pseudonocardia lacus]|uniref:hypothetical protein n=1 Tax=Pseudonocardia lacus TaxID=2835865 RepID=UPI001BDC4940|nr:hypothetical protein [Pseudonocardia lacus]